MDPLTTSRFVYTQEQSRIITTPPRSYFVGGIYFPPRSYLLQKAFFSPRCPSCGSYHPCFERRFPASSYKTRKICVCPLITHDRCTSLATITDVPLLLWKHILYPYMHIHMLHDANRLSHFSLHLALEEADSVPRGTCLTPALEVQIPSLECPCSQGPNSLFEKPLYVMFPSSRRSLSLEARLPS